MSYLVCDDLNLLLSVKKLYPTLRQSMPKVSCYKRLLYGTFHKRERELNHMEAVQPVCSSCAPRGSGHREGWLGGQWGLVIRERFLGRKTGTETLLQ